MSVEKKVWYAPNKKEAYGDREIQAVIDCLNDGWLAGFGPKTVQFEKETAKLFSKKFVLSINESLLYEKRIYNIEHKSFNLN